MCPYSEIFFSIFSPIRTKNEKNTTVSFSRLKFGSESYWTKIVLKTFSIISSHFKNSLSTEKYLFFKATWSDLEFFKIFKVREPPCAGSYSTVNVQLKMQKSYVVVTIVLRNYPRLTNKAIDTSAVFIDSKALSNGEKQTMYWPQIVGDVADMTFYTNYSCLKLLNNHVSMHEGLKSYVNCKTEYVEWQ